ncbi:MAG: hypothetical protein WCO98_06390 [bacterium]
MKRKIIFRTEVVSPEKVKVYLVVFDPWFSVTSRFLGPDDKGIQKWLIDNKIVHRDAQFIFKDITMIDDKNEVVVFLLSRTFCKNKIDKEYELKLIEKLIWDWDVEEVVKFQTILKDIVEMKKAGGVNTVEAKSKYYVIDPDGIKRIVKGNRLTNMAMVKKESGWRFSGGDSIPDSIEEEKRHEWALVDVKTDD